MRELGTRVLALRVDAPNSASDPYAATTVFERQAAQVSRVVVTSAAPDPEMTTFGDKAAGARLYRLDFIAVQDLASSSLWQTVWQHTGEVVPIELYPEGVSIGLSSKFTMEARISEPDGDFIGGDADASPTSRFRFACSWALQAKPALSLAYEPYTPPEEP
ncbi:MAG: hypothetical protein OSB43_18020 [Nocardioides sp.]|uniref:hypothetical protein n=1 Tax=Nocardioides sp. TaxID=35761 RepID=UPI0023A0EEE4|nr:hypothetical protein [Nocardioides sp.]MDE0778181.1 hypothetical protein [Nocardioides sp.]